jgi:hypothetical protein
MGRVDVTARVAITINEIAGERVAVRILLLCLRDHESLTLSRQGPVAIGIAIGADEETDVKTLLGGQHYLKVRRERDIPGRVARARLVRGRASALAPGTNTDVGHLGNRDVIGRTLEFLSAEEILHTIVCCCSRRRLGPHEEPPYRQDTDQDGEQSCEQVPELRVMFHVDSSMPRARHT